MDDRGVAPREVSKEDTAMAMSNTFDAYRKDGQRAVLTAWNPILWIFVPLYVLAKITMFVTAALFIQALPPFSTLWTQLLGGVPFAPYKDALIPLAIPYLWVIVPGEHLFVFAAAFAVAVLVRVPVCFTARPTVGSSRGRNLAERIDDRFQVVIFFALLAIGFGGLLGVAAFAVNVAIFLIPSMLAFGDFLGDLFGQAQFGGLLRQRFWKMVYEDAGFRYTFPMAMISPAGFLMAGLHLGWMSLMDRRRSN